MFRTFCFGHNAAGVHVNHSMLLAKNEAELIHAGSNHLHSVDCGSDMLIGVAFCHLTFIVEPMELIVGPELIADSCQRQLL